MSLGVLTPNSISDFGLRRVDALVIVLFSFSAFVLICVIRAYLPKTEKNSFAFLRVLRGDSYYTQLLSNFPQTDL